MSEKHGDGRKTLSCPSLFPLEVSSELSSRPEAGEPLFPCGCFMGDKLLVLVLVLIQKIMGEEPFSMAFGTV